MALWFRHFSRLSALLVALACGGTTASQAWGLEEVSRLAAERAQRPWQPTQKDTGSGGLGYDTLRDIRFRPEHRLWRGQALAFQAEPLHGAHLAGSVRLHEVSPAGVREIAHVPSTYDPGRNSLSEALRQALGHGGFKLLHPLHQADKQDEVLAFQGASYFRALGQGQRYGLSARGLAMDTGGEEEFPRFTDFWLEKPRPGAGRARLWALLESPRVSGAYAFEVTPGPHTQLKVQARLFFRPGLQPLRSLGLAPLTSMFLHGENQPQPGDFRPEVHDSDGLMMAAANGEWLWRPLSNPLTPQASSFRFDGIRGFGLMQRDRSFASYEDAEARYELRPSAWVTPLGDWGPGRIELYQYHTPDETHDNVSAYWVPERLPQPGQSLDFTYLISWQGQTQQKPPGGWALQSRLGQGYVADSAKRHRQLQYVVDFGGPALDGLPDDAPVQAVASSSAAGLVVESLVYRHPVTRSWRMTLRVERIDASQPIELRAFLQHGKDTLTETWTTLTTP